MASMIFNCCICCMIISVWGIVQLFLMGVFYYVEAVTLLEDVEAEEYDDYDDFIRITKNNYNATAINCWIAMGIYILTLIVSCTCILQARSKAKAQAAKQDEEENE